MRWFICIIVAAAVMAVIISYLIVERDDIPESGETGIYTPRVKVYIKETQTVKNMPLEYYVAGVTGAEMPASFPLEALKAQAVAARTYAVSRMARRKAGKYDDAHSEADVCTDFSHCQAWASKQELSEKWGLMYSLWYWRKIIRSVYETRGEIITYKGDVINPVFHANSGGRTENPEEVWQGGSVPYLKSVVSEGEEIAPHFSDRVELDKSSFVNTIKGKFPGFRIGDDIIGEISIKSFTTGGRVGDIKIGNIVLRGTEVRALFGLRSANFKIFERNGKIVFETKGYGHGVGMSQWGAYVLATKGVKYTEILKYYYTGVEVEKALLTVNCIAPMYIISK